VHTIRMLRVVLVLSGISTLGQGQSSATGAPVPNLVNFAGTLKDSRGHPIQSVTGVTFSLYAQEEGGTPLWLETQNVQADGKGNYSVQLGATKAEGCRWSYLLRARPVGSACGLMAVKSNHACCW
jgi:hypothetical protein